MQKVILALVVTGVAAGAATASEPTSAADKAGVMATVHQWVDGIATGDMSKVLATCADQTSIIDDIPPHEWHGAGACAAWLNDFGAWAKKNNISEPSVTTGSLRRVIINLDHAYVVMPTSLTFKQKGKLTKPPRAAVAFALQKVDAGWRIIGWSWAD